MQQLVMIVHVFAAAGLIGLVLLQHGKGADAGAAFGSGASGSIFGARGPASFLTRLTAFLAGTFFVTSLSLGYLASNAVDRSSVMERVVGEQTEPLSETDGTPRPSDVPVVPGGEIADTGDIPDVPSENSQ